MIQNKWWWLWRGQGNVRWHEGRRWWPFCQALHSKDSSTPQHGGFPPSFTLLSLLHSPCQLWYPRVDGRQQNTSENRQKPPLGLRTWPWWGATLLRRGSRVTAQRPGELDSLASGGQGFKRGWGRCELSVLGVRTWGTLKSAEQLRPEEMAL